MYQDGNIRGKEKPKKETHKEEKMTLNKLRDTTDKAEISMATEGGGRGTKVLYHFTAKEVRREM